MQRIVGVTKLRRNFSPYLEEVVRSRIPLVLTRDSRPAAALISYEDYLRFQEMQEREVVARFDKVWDRLGVLNDKRGEQEIGSDIKAARRR